MADQATKTVAPVTETVANVIKPVAETTTKTQGIVHRPA